MEIVEVILSIIYFIACISLIVIVMLQDSKSEGSVITGEQTSYFSSKKGKNKEQVLSSLTIFLGVFFGVLALVLGAILVWFIK